MVARFYDDTLEEFAAAIAAVRYVLDGLGGLPSKSPTCKEAYNLITGRRWNRLTYANCEDSGIPHDVTSLYEFLTSEISKSNHVLDRNNVNTDSHKDLIDTIVQILQLPYADARFTPKVITALRKAVLLPEEILNFNSEIQKQELCCYKCNKPFTAFESATAVKVGTSMAFGCNACTPPATIRCRCGKPKNTSDAFRRRVKKETVCTCNAVPVEAPVPPLPDDSL